MVDSSSASSSVVLSSYAPTEFQVVNSSFDSRTTTISVAVEHCQLCGGSRRPFYCRDCVRAGRFHHSDLQQLPHRRRSSPAVVPGTAGWTRDAAAAADGGAPCYDRKVTEWNRTKQKCIQLSNRFMDMITGNHRCIKKRTELEESKKRNRLLKMAIQNATKQVTEGLGELDRFRKNNSVTSENISSLKSEMTETTVHVQAFRESFQQVLKQLEKINGKILSWRRKHICHLIKYIFPIDVVQQKSDSDTSMKARVSLLAEARHTAYVKGRWIKGHSEWEEMYRIVQPILPGNGDYNLCSIRVHEGVDSVLHTSVELPRLNESWNVMAGLCFMTQLVHQLAFYLGVRLPWNLHYREFCMAEMTEKQLNTAVFKLNCNIIHLCYMQNVNLEGLHPRHTICNLRTLLDHPDLGKSVVSADAESMNAIEDSLLNGSDDLDLSDSTDRADAVEKEWEHVPVTLPELEMPSRMGSTSYLSAALQSQSRTTGQETQSTVTSIASGLMSSAITSIWRGWGKSDK